MKSTQAMRDRARELMSKEMDDYDRAFECVLDDLEGLLAPAQSAPDPALVARLETHAVRYANDYGYGIADDLLKAAAALRAPEAADAGAAPDYFEVAGRMGSALVKVLSAWDALKPGLYSDREMTEWINGDDMKSAIKAARDALSVPSTDGKGGVA